MQNQGQLLIRQVASFRLIQEECGKAHAVHSFFASEACHGHQQDPEITATAFGAVGICKQQVEKWVDSSRVIVNSKNVGELFWRQQRIAEGHIFVSTKLAEAITHLLHIGRFQI